MKKNELKIALLQKIIACDDLKLLLEVDRILQENLSEVREEEIEYQIDNSVDIVPDWHYEELQKDIEKYERGELQTSSWEEIKARLKKEHGF